jgi:carboxyl-terminal processing protease
MFATLTAPFNLLLPLFNRLRIPLAVLGILSSLGIGAHEPDPGQITISVARMLENLHYSRLRLDEPLARRFLRNYLETLDYNHFFFTQQDIEYFESEWGGRLHEEILNGRTLAAHQIRDVFRSRVQARIAYAKLLLNEGLDLHSQRNVEVNRQKAPWPANEEAAVELWRDRVTSELLQEYLSQKKASNSNSNSNSNANANANANSIPPKTPEQLVEKRYNQFLKNLQEETPEEVVKTFLQCLALTYDPHSDYLNKADLEQFGINMRLSLFGIGAKLRAEDGYAKIIELVPGGPALKSGKMRVGDRILGVAQGRQDFVDCVDLKLDKVVNMIRGKKDSIVRLQILPVNAADPTEWSVVELRREEVKLKDEEAHGELIEWTKPNGQSVKLGWVVVPSFYGEPDRSSNPQAKSTTRDVSAILQRLKQEGIQGLIMDLRRNGGGYLDEAVNLSGLFIRKGPVVQVKSWNGEIAVLRDKDPKIEYDGPLMVLVNRQSASASEIFSAALQDYRRAVILGDSKTFGKGTVQQMIELNRALPFLSPNSNDAGAVKLTIQKFYRVAGGATQLKGVESDIMLPSIFDQPEIGEDSLKDPLPYDTIESLDFEKWDKPLHLDELRRRSRTRIPANLEFTYAAEDLERIRARTAENKLSLNQTARKAEIEEDRKRKRERDLKRGNSPKPKEPRAFKVHLEGQRKELVPIHFVEPKAEASAIAGNSDKNPVPDRARPLNNPFEGEDLPAEGLLEAATDKDGKLFFKSPPVRLDPVKTESLNILSDLVELSKIDAPAAARRR